MVAKSVGLILHLQRNQSNQGRSHCPQPDQPNHQSRHPTESAFALIYKASPWVGLGPWTPPLTFISILPSNSPCLLFCSSPWLWKPLEYLSLLNEDSLDHTFSLPYLPMGVDLLSAMPIAGPYFPSSLLFHQGYFAPHGTALIKASSISCSSLLASLQHFVR